ncbi:MAG: 7TMR-DISM family protein, partial [Owenweeksia sp.]
MKKKRKVYLKLFLVLALAFGIQGASRAQLVVGEQKESNIGQSLQLLEDSNCISLDQAIAGEFTPEDDNVPLYEGSETCLWFKLPVLNNSGEDQLLLEIYNPAIDLVELYYKAPDGSWAVKRQGRTVPISQWDFDLPNIIFEIDIEDGAEEVFYIKVKNPEQFSLPVNLGLKDEIMITSFRDQILFGLYAGIMLALFLYNIFIYFSVRDRSYIFYVAHTLFVLLTQASAFGFAYLYLWPGNTWLVQHSFVLFTCLVSLAGIRFFFEFLKVKHYLPRFYKFFRAMEVVYLLILVVEIMDFRNLAYQMLFPLQGIIVISIFVASLMILIRGYQPAKLYVMSWSLLLIGVLIFALKDFSILPYNYLTVHTIQIGSALEAVLLSFALADKINILKREKE